MKKSKDKYEELLNEEFTVEETLRETEHCWAGNDKTQYQKLVAKKLAREGKYGTILRKFDPIAFNVGYYDFSN
mgnify:CR=1 FL=1